MPLPLGNKDNWPDIYAEISCLDGMVYSELGGAAVCLFAYLFR